MQTIALYDLVGQFGENKDIAQEIRKNTLIPALERGEDITLDFKGVESVTQSFTHALISDLIRTYGQDVLDKISFKNCNDTVQKIIGIVIEYMQES